MSNKTISINTNYFQLSGSKTKKNKEKKEKEKVLKTLINPNVLKNKFLKRIKEHKQSETQNIDPKKNEVVQKTSDLQAYTDEFSDSINYLQTLSKQKKVNDEKTNYEKQKQKKKEALERKTLKHHPPQNNSQNFVNIDLPEELQIIPSSVEPNIVLKRQVIDPVPYGVLKGGKKPTYRDWSKTQRNYNHSSPVQPIKRGSEREMRLENLREKLKNKQKEEVKHLSEPITGSITGSITESITESITPTITPTITESITPAITEPMKIIATKKASSSRSGLSHCIKT